jgi:hypothetical protein
VIEGVVGRRAVDSWGVIAASSSSVPLYLFYTADEQEEWQSEGFFVN